MSGLHVVRTCTPVEASVKRQRRLAQDTGGEQGQAGKRVQIEKEREKGVASKWRKEAAKKQNGGDRRMEDQET